MANEAHAGAFRCTRVQTVGAVNGLASELSHLSGAGIPEYPRFSNLRTIWSLRGIEASPSHEGLGASSGILTLLASDPNSFSATLCHQRP
jgi:hypothetical protein